MLTTSVLASLFWMPSSGFAQSAEPLNQRLYIDTQKKTEITFESPSWNKKSKVQESRTLFLRNRKTGELVGIELRETSSNSGIFTAKFDNLWKDSEKFVTPEIYLGSELEMASPEAARAMQQEIRKGLVPRKAFFLEPNDEGQRIVVHNSKAEAFENFARFMRIQSEKRELEEVMARAQEAAELEKTRQLEIERLKAVEQMKLAQEQAEKIKREEALRKQKELDQRTRQLRKQQAAEFSRKAMEAYQKREFKLAEELFGKSVDLDPENNQIYFQYGVSAYQNGNDLKAIALLKIADYGDFSRYERDYYKGLAYFRLKDLDPAESAFASVLSLNDQKLAPSAAFFLGVVRFQREKYTEAKDAFEFVLDQSTDPALDRQADSYIEQIANILSFQEKQKKPWTLSFNAGLLSDSNILSAATNTATEQSGYRLSIGAGVDYRFRYKEKSEASIRWSLSDLNSVWNSRFQYNDSFQRYDPLVTSLTNPWKWRRQWGQTPVQIGLTPGFDTIHMDVDGLSNEDFLTRFYSLRRRELILSSVFLKNDYSFVLRPQWLSTPSIEIRSDTSMIEASEEEDQKALKTTLNWNNAWFLDEKLSRGHLVDLGASVNSALGNNQKYQRWDMSYSFITGILKDSGLSARLNYASVKYPNHSSSRSDSQINASLGLRTPLGKKWVWVNSLGHSINSSNLDSFQYSRTTLQSSFEWSDLF